MAGKGSNRRPTNEQRVRENWPMPDHYKEKLDEKHRRELARRQKQAEKQG